jgi:hypothetical protein
MTAVYVDNKSLLQLCVITQGAKSSAAVLKLYNELHKITVILWSSGMRVVDRYQHFGATTYRTTRHLIL